MLVSDSLWAYDTKHECCIFLWSCLSHSQGGGHMLCGPYWGCVPLARVTWFSSQGCILSKNSLIICIFYFLSPYVRVYFLGKNLESEFGAKLLSVFGFFFLIKGSISHLWGSWLKSQKNRIMTSELSLARVCLVKGIWTKTGGTGWRGPCPPWGKFSSTCAFPVWRNARKSKYIFMRKNNSAL